MIGLNYQTIVQQIRTLASSTFPYVAYCAVPNQIEDLSTNPTLPAAFVSPMGKEAEPNDVKSGGDIRQRVTEHFCIVVQFANGGDLLAQNSSNQIPTFRETLRSTLVNWHPLPLTRTVQPIVEGNDEAYLYKAGAYTCWMFRYSVSYQITTADSYTPATTSPMTITPNLIPTSGPLMLLENGDFWLLENGEYIELESCTNG